ncbi:MAG TPA: metal ABC transporter permease [Thermoanaerobaculia bacterium]|nr:metal ABC transporter permease [Thermoanaerobaculia bacterium]
MLLDLFPEFLRWPVLTALVVGAAAPAIGFFLVERQMSVVGDAIGHTAFAGVALAHLLGLNPVATAVAVSVLAAAAVETLRTRNRAAGDRLLALLLYTGLALGMVLASVARAVNAGLFAFLFGSILTVDGPRFAVVGCLAGIVLGALALLYRRLLAVTIDDEAARAAGLPVLRVNLVLATLAALTVSLAMQAVGLLLIAALMVVPVLTSNLFAWSVRSSLLLAMGLGLVASLGGLTIAYFANLPPGGTTVLTAVALYGLALLFQGLLRRG